jgi:hypothetical protein
MSETKAESTMIIIGIVGAIITAAMLPVGILSTLGMINPECTEDEISLERDKWISKRK